MDTHTNLNINEATELCEIMGNHKSDKGHKDIINSWHNYTVFYYKLFEPIRYNRLRIFELGLGTNNPYIPSNMGINGRPGASLYGWRDFFINSSIYGADIDHNILFNSERIKTFYCDQTNPHIIKYMWNEPDLLENFDIIIEDGLHTFEANVCFFENSIHKLNNLGYYIIEDIKNTDIPSFINKINDWKNNDKFAGLEFRLVQIPSYRNNSDNTLIVVHKST